MKKGLKFTKKQLEKLYWGDKLSLSQIGNKFGCNGTNILYWLKKFNIKRRPANYRKIHIPKEVLRDLYWNKHLPPRKIAKKFGIKNERTVRKKLEKHNIPRKTLSQATTKKFKAPFSGNLEEKAYFLGLRAGDFHVKTKNISPRIQTTSTHLAQIGLTKNAFQNYAETKVYSSKNKAREDEWFIYADLHPSFGFLLKKPETIPDWILNDNACFYNFLAAYMDCEGTWNVIKSHEKHTRFIFRIRTGDKDILKQIKAKLEIMNYTPRLYFKKLKGIRRGYGVHRNDMYEVTLYRKEEVLDLIKELLPLSKHTEKVRKMNFILENKNNKWKEIVPGWNDLREEIKTELLKNQANQAMINPHI